ncbi:hypothetical protein PSH55_21945, partial [Pseudoalteromonas sp. Angola-31]|nr:hypothetical protein [Pseudoalteromonas sp. Angola-31]
DKYVLRILRTLADAELSNALKAHGRKIRGISRTDKIQTIIHSGISAAKLLSDDIHNVEDNQNQRKDRLKQLIQDLEIDTDKLGTTLDERIGLILSSLSGATEKEFDSLSASGFKQLLKTLEEHFPTMQAVLKDAFELEANEIIDTEKLRAFSIT